MMPGETILSGAPNICEDCGMRLIFKVLISSAPYIGTQCECGPHSRESHYFSSVAEAETALKTDPMGLKWRR
jgi:hypothetical protein